MASWTVQDADTYLSYFPNTRFGTTLPLSKTVTGIPLFSQVCHEHIHWLQTGNLTDIRMRREEKTLENDTIHGYALKLRSVWIPAFNGLTVTDIDEDVLCAALEQGMKPKTTNNWLVPLHGVMRLARKKYKSILKYNPVADIQNQRLGSHSMIDPFNKRERDVLLAWLCTHKHPMIYAYYLFAFYSGVRCPSESLGLDVEHIDAYGDPMPTVRICQRVSHQRQINVEGSFFAISITH